MDDSVAKSIMVAKNTVNLIPLIRVVIQSTNSEPRRRCGRHRYCQGLDYAEGVDDL